MQRSSVDLPEPDGPMMHTASPRSHRERDAAQHLDRAERLVHVDEADDRRVVGAAPSSDRLRRAIGRRAALAGDVDDPRRVAGRGEEALEVGVREDHRRRVDQRMRLDRRRLPQRAVDDEFDGRARVVDERQQADRARRDRRGASAAARATRNRAADAERRRQRLEVDREVVRHRHQEMPPPFLSRRNRFFVFAPGSFGTSRTDSSTVITAGCSWRGGVRCRAVAQEIRVRDSISAPRSALRAAASTREIG